jgi:response regulator RpfG family c-di-GMP phosphodiesterase
MPGMRGTDFLKEVRTHYPDTVRCILSGYAEMNSVVAAINDGNVYRFISKPWDDLEIKTILNECVGVANKSIEDNQVRISLKNRATALEKKSAQFAELLELKNSLLKSSRDVLEHLPVPVVALDAQGRMIYTNQRFSSEFGHLSGTVLGQYAGEPWARAVNDNIIGDAEFIINNEVYNAQIEQINIGGYQHTLIAMSPNRK